MKGKKEIGIFELSELFGITPAAIRKYEAKGIIQPNRDKENGYRKYSTWEVVKLVKARSLGMQGLSLNQAAEMLETQELDDHVSMIETLQQRIAKEIVYKRRLISLLDQQKKEYAESRDRSGRLQIEQVSALYCCKLTENGKVVDKAGKELEILKTWIAALPFVNLCYIYNDDFEMCTCLAIKEEDRNRFDLTHLVPEFVIPEKICVVCDVVIQRNETQYSAVDVLENAMEKVKKLGFQIEDKKMLWLYAYTQKDNSYRSYIKGLFPIVT